MRYQVRFTVRKSIGILFGRAHGYNMVMGFRNAAYCNTNTKQYDGDQILIGDIMADINGESILDSHVSKVAALMKGSDNNNIQKSSATTTTRRTSPNHRDQTIDSDINDSSSIDGFDSTIDLIRIDRSQWFHLLYEEKIKYQVEKSGSSKL